MIKKIWIIVMFCISIILLGGCSFKTEIPYPHSFETNSYYGYAFNEKEAAVGAFRKTNEEYLFIPWAIMEENSKRKYEVVQLGYRSVKYSQVDGVFSTFLNQRVVTRFYVPGCIDTVYDIYFKNYSIYGGVKYFYCGKTIDLSPFQLGNEEDIIYVPHDRYDDFINKTSNIQIKILKANVEYCLNYEGNELYYIDYYSNDEIIEYIPPVPERDGFIFDGWYKEPTCINEWNFNEEKIVFDTEEFNITKLYAKWIAN